ncbi:MAG TPA: hypothetical protein VFX38_07820, partial [Gammaproteobacteria bacterium]|nr:hypothetical protein [Gammaproteobacteria bacterium]
APRGGGDVEPPRLNDGAQTTTMLPSRSEQAGMTQHDDPASPRPELDDSAAITEQDEEYASRSIPPVTRRVRYWHIYRGAGIVTACAGVVMMIAGHFADSHRSMQIAGFLILSGAVVFTIGVIGSWITRQRPLD